MVVSGFEAVTLVDFPGVIASVVFTSGCNLRCRFCHNPELALGRGGDRTAEFLAYIKTARVDGVSVTGGEPLLHDDLAEFLKHIKSLGLKVKLDTNGSFPDRLRNILAEKLADYVALDVKGLNPEETEFITRERFLHADGFYKVFSVLKESGTDFEVRLTVWKTFEEADIKSFCEQISGAKLFLQRARAERLLDRRFSDNIRTVNFEEVQKRFEKYMPVMVR